MDTTTLSSPANLSDQDLLARTMQLAANERQATALLIAHLAELDARRLYLAEGFSSLFTYCIQVLRLSENHGGLLDRARHKSKRAVEELLTGLYPQPPVPAVIRRLPAAGHHPVPPALLDGARAGSPALLAAPPSGRPATVAPLAPQRYKVQFTARAETYEKLRLAQDLLRHQIPDGDLDQILSRALTALLEDLARQQCAATDRPRGGRPTAPGTFRPR